MLVINGSFIRDRCAYLLLFLIVRCRRSAGPPPSSPHSNHCHLQGAAEVDLGHPDRGAKPLQALHRSLAEPLTMAILAVTMTSVAHLMASTSDSRQPYRLSNLLLVTELLTLIAGTFGILASAISQSQCTLVVVSSDSPCTLVRATAGRGGPF